MTINVRIAPSPTGLLHIGNIRAALFNFLYARKHGGSFMLRLDDTDGTRSTQEFADAIKRDLSWLGLTWDAFARQSDRIARYGEVLEQLKKSGRVYACYETQSELDLKRKTQLGRGLPPVYDRGALKLSDEERAAFEAQGRKPHWRFKLNHTDVVWEDIIQGRKSFPAAALSDPVLVREDGIPLYTFCSVVDDVDDKTSHIIRGEDHVTNTAVQIQIWQAVTNIPHPVFAHFPLIVSANGIEMSKRLATLSIASMRDEMHVEPMAINTLIATLGTSDAIARHATIDELVASFDLEKISHSTPKFDLEELKMLNAKILHITPFDTVRERLATMGLGAIDESFWNVARANITTLPDIRQWWLVATGPVTPVITNKEFLAQASDLLPGGVWDVQTWGSWIEALKNTTGRKGKELFMPLRLALTTYDHGPEMKYLLPLIGEKRARDLLAGRAA